jgi:hypothetical protein
MSVEIIDAQAIPQSSFVRRSRILDPKEYKETVAALAGIKVGKALRVTLSAETCAVTKAAGMIGEARRISLNWQTDTLILSSSGDCN